MENSFLKITPTQKPLAGVVEVSGAKNATLVMMCACLIAAGKTVLYNVPFLLDVISIGNILRALGATVIHDLDHKVLTIDTTHVSCEPLSDELMGQTRASILILGALLARFGKAIIQGGPGGDAIGARPIDFHLKNFKKMGVMIVEDGNTLIATVKSWKAQHIVLDFPSVGATENLLLAATAILGKTIIVNAAIEPEVLNLIEMLSSMGVSIKIIEHATILIEGGKKLEGIHTYIIPDRLEAGALLIAGAMTAGDITVSNIYRHDLELLLLKLEEMGNEIFASYDKKGIRIIGSSVQRAIKVKTAPFPGFATDLQPTLMAALLTAQGTSVIEEMVFENRLQHVDGFQSLGGSIIIKNPHKAIVAGVPFLQGGIFLQPADIRAACAFVLTGLITKEEISVGGLYHFRRGFESLDFKLNHLGAMIQETVL